MGKVNKKENMSDEKTRDKRIVAIFGIIGALTAILISMITARDFFAPAFVKAVVIVLLIMIVIVNGYGIFGYKILREVKKFNKAKKENTIAKDLFNEFDGFLDKFSEFLEPRRCDNILYTLHNVQSKESIFRELSIPSVDHFNKMFITMRNILEKSPRNKETFLLFVEFFSLILNAYNKLCICEPVEDVRRILRKDNKKIREDDKEEYRRHKSVYDKFVMEYTDFAKVINKKFNYKVARDFFERPKELS